MNRAKEAAATMRLGGGIGYDFSPLRPFGALIKKLQSSTSGPVAFMNIFDAMCACIKSAGHRRGAQMGVLRIDHPDIERFIHAKQNGTALTNFNISVAVTEMFMEALKHNTPFDLRFKGEVYRTIDPVALWEMLMRSTWDWADPGVIFIDRINEWNNLWYCETIAATNPCGEQPLPPYGACLLGSVNLVRFLKWVGSKFIFDWDLLKGAIPHIVRAMDNVIDRTIYPLKKQEIEAKNKRRMGLGVTGLANALEAMGFPYGSDGFLNVETAVLECLRDNCYRASIELAKEKGSFKQFDKNMYLRGKFIQTLPKDIQNGIEKHGIRNSHLLSIAPTGTISLAAGNVSSGIEPVYEYEYNRDIITPQGPKTFTLSDFGYRELGVRGKRIKDLSVDDHVRVLITAQRFVDSAVSKTVNIPKDYDWTDFKQVYLNAYEGGAKGCTTYREGGKRESIFSSASEGGSCTIDEGGRKSCE
jgi:ribonucleoside-diphosphate reductase alpha chain